MVEGARLEIVWAEMSRRFESSRFRQNVCIDSLVAECRFGRSLFEAKVSLSLLMVAESVNERDAIEAMPYLC